MRKNNGIFRRILNITAVSSIILSLLTQGVYADVLGTHISQKKTVIAPETAYVRNVFSDSSVGRQTENYIEYKPNSLVKPVLSNGYSAYGKRTLAQASEILKDRGINPAGGINADFFSFQTGVPMSNTILDGRIFTADDSDMWGVGFRSDGTAFFAKFPVKITLTTDKGEEFAIECINKYRQPYALYLFNKDFGDNTHSPQAGTDITLGNVSGAFTVNGSVTATVESFSENEGSVPIPEGKLILSVARDTAEEIKSRLSVLSVGQRVTIRTEVTSSPQLWEQAVYGTGALGGKLLTDGQLDLEDEGSAPRTALGVKADGSVIFYTIDGRQKGYSYGVRKETLARRLLELGCTDAINLDGGGSTSIGIAPVNSYDFNIVNSPSDGVLRSCANFLFLTKPFSNGIPYSMIMENDGAYMLAGSSLSLKANIVDSSYTYTDATDAVKYTIDKDAGTADLQGRRSYIDENGYLTVWGNGEVYVSAKSGDMQCNGSVLSVATPEYLQIHNRDNGNQLTAVQLNPSESVPLKAKSFWGGRELVSENDCYRWTVVNNSGSIGEIDSDGVFHASSQNGATGTIAVSAGICSLEIPVTIGTAGNVPSLADTPKIEGIVTEGRVVASISYPDIKKENITVTCDNKAVEFGFNQATGTVTYDAGEGCHRIGIFVTADDKMSAMKHFDTENITRLASGFTDTDSHWARGYIAYLKDLGIVNGSLDDGNVIRFNPDNNMTRVEFAIMLCNYLGVNPVDYKDTELPFIDKDEIPWWAEDRVKAIYSLGIMQGQLGQYGVSFSPNVNINRMEFAISLNRLLPEGLGAEPITALDKDEIPFWAEESMRVICTQGIMTGYPDGSLRPLRSVTRAEAVKMLYNILGA